MISAMTRQSCALPYDQAVQKPLAMLAGLGGNAAVRQLEAPRDDVEPDRRSGCLAFRSADF
jgi:hypothetical protein